MPKKTKQLVKNTVKLDMAFEDMKRALAVNMEREDKVHAIEKIISNLYV